MGHHPRPVRLSYAGTVVRLRGSELAPAREWRQIGAELIGLDSTAAATEVVRVAVEALVAAGTTGISIDFTLPDLVDLLAAGPLPVAADQVAALRDRLDAKDAGGVAAIAPDYLPLVEAAGPFATAMERLRAFDTQGVLASRLDALEAIRPALGEGVSMTLDPTERHGFEFQSWLGFSLFVAGPRARSDAAAPIRFSTRTARRRRPPASRSMPTPSSPPPRRPSGGGCSCPSAPNLRRAPRSARRAG